MNTGWTNHTHSGDLLCELFFYKLFNNSDHTLQVTLQLLPITSLFAAFELFIIIVCVVDNASMLSVWLSYVLDPVITLSNALLWNPICVLKFQTALKSVTCPC